MIEVVRPAVAMSVQDAGRFGHRLRGLAQSGAMDRVALDVGNLLAGAAAGCAAVEIGPSPCELRVARRCSIAFTGAPRRGIPWWERLEVSAGTAIALPSPLEGVWSYLAVEGGVDADAVAGSRSTNVREGIGRWLTKGDLIHPGSRPTPAEEIEEPPALTGPVRIFGELPGRWRIGRATDRMGYQLEGDPLRGGMPADWSEPILPGFIQLPPSGLPIVLMTEASTVGGYEVPAVVHSDDLRLVAQTQLGACVEFVDAEV